jgi:hypothetical protein
MSASRFVLAFAFVLSLGACHRDRCLSMCQQHERELGCKPDSPLRSCKVTCDDLHQETPCSAETKEWEACLMELPANQWECNPAGQPVPKEAGCQGVRDKVVRCISKFPEWPPPKK